MIRRRHGVMAWALVIMAALGAGCKPKNPYYYLKRGDEEYKKGDYEQAEKFYQEALQRKQDLAEAYYGLGMVHYQKRNIDRAIELFRKARAMKPQLVEAYYQEAMIYQLMGKDRKYEAIPLYVEALEIKPDFRDARLNLGLLYENMGAFEEARVVYEDGLKTNPNDREIREALARVREKLAGGTAPPPEP